MNMKTLKITYWITTAIVALMMLFSAYMYLNAPMVQQSFHRLGFPDYLRVELAIAKIIGVVLLLIPVARVKEWAYAGFAITFISAFVAHTESGDPSSIRIMPVIFLILLAVSYYTYYKRSHLQQVK
jgi:hypothetical protein